MVDMRFELTTSTAQVLSSTLYVEALVRWATGKRLTDRLPKVSFITKRSLAAVSSTRWVLLIKYISFLSHRVRAFLVYFHE